MTIIIKEFISFYVVQTFIIIPFTKYIIFTLVESFLREYESKNIIIFIYSSCLL